jgi:Na+/H+ antiporter NhaD/arsenite permease-like protein
MTLASLLPALPFASILLALLIVPAACPALWHRPLRRFGLLLLLAAPAAVADAQASPWRLGHALDEYASFLLLLWALYQLACGIVLRGPFAGSPKSNVGLLALGATLASVIGTTGASMLLLPVLLRANQGRAHVRHLVVLFIFLVSNAGGLLLPLGDPPLFLGFLHGVPFFWTLRMWPLWLANVGGLLAVAYALDARAYRQEDASVRLSAGRRGREPWRLEGKGHALGFLAVAALLGFGPAVGLGGRIQQAALAAIALAALRAMPAHVRAFNAFEWEPLIEVAVLFLPLFLAMPRALAVVAQHQALLPLSSAESLYWWTGGLSSVLDNAPCYLTFATLANANLGFAGADLRELAAAPAGVPRLMAVAHGAVSMGAMTYIGNGPNLMVRQRAERAGVPMPSFFGYLGWALALLLPVLWLSRMLVGLI